MDARKSSALTAVVPVGSPTTAPPVLVPEPVALPVPAAPPVPVEAPEAPDDAAEVVALGVLAHASASGIAARGRAWVQRRMARW